MGRHATCRYPSQESSLERYEKGTINQLCLERAKIQESRNQRAANAFTVANLAYQTALEEQNRQASMAKTAESIRASLNAEQQVEHGSDGSKHGKRASSGDSPCRLIPYGFHGADANFRYMYPQQYALQTLPARDHDVIADEMLRRPATSTGAYSKIVTGEAATIHERVGSAEAAESRARHEPPLGVMDQMELVEMEHGLIKNAPFAAQNLDLNSLGTAAGSDFRPMTAEGGPQAVRRIGVGVGPSRAFRESAEDRVLQLEFENINEQARLQSDYANSSGGILPIATDSKRVNARRKLFNANGAVILPHDRLPRGGNNLKSLVGRDAVLLSYDQRACARPDTGMAKESRATGVTGSTATYVGGGRKTVQAANNNTMRPNLKNLEKHGRVNSQLMKGVGLTPLTASTRPPAPFGPVTGAQTQARWASSQMSSR